MIIPRFIETSVETLYDNFAGKRLVIAQQSNGGNSLGIITEAKDFKIEMSHGVFILTINSTSFSISYDTDINMNIIDGTLIFGDIGNRIEIIPVKNKRRFF